MEGVKGGVLDPPSAIINSQQCSGLDQHKFTPTGLEAKGPNSSYLDKAAGSKRE